MNKRNVIVALIGLNVLLAAALVFTTVDPPSAMAQSRGRPGDFAMATIQIHEDYDALALINIPAAKLYFFVAREQGNTAQVTPSDVRDLNRDFER